jgi:hypothetical protein
VALAGNFALAAEVLFVNAVPISDIGTPASPVLRTTINFSNFGDYNGTGIAVNGAYLYMTGSSGIGDRGSFGSTRLFIGQYLPLEDRAPSAALSQPPAPKPEVREREVVLCHVCGDMMQRAGSCYACPSCGSTSGCS